jgi:hypothetical protein
MFNCLGTNRLARETDKRSKVPLIDTDWNHQILEVRRHANVQRLWPQEAMERQKHRKQRCSGWNRICGTDGEMLYQIRAKLVAATCRLARLRGCSERVRPLKVEVESQKKCDDMPTAKITQGGTNVCFMRVSGELGTRHGYEAALRRSVCGETSQQASATVCSDLPAQGTVREADDVGSSTSNHTLYIHKQRFQM